METIIEHHLPAIRQLMQQHGVEQAFLFGSAAKGTMVESSDVDFIIRFPPTMHYTTYANNYFSLAHALEQLLQKKVELVAEETLKNPYLLQSINSHKLALL